MATAPGIQGLRLSQVLLYPTQLACFQRATLDAPQPPDILLLPGGSHQLAAVQQKPTIGSALQVLLRAGTDLQVRPAGSALPRLLTLLIGG